MGLHLLTHVIIDHVNARGSISLLLDHTEVLSIPGQQPYMIHYILGERTAPVPVANKPLSMLTNEHSSLCYTSTCIVQVHYEFIIAE